VAVSTETSRRRSMTSLLADMSGAHDPASERLTDQVAGKIALGIVSGKYATGEQLPNETAFGDVSRTAYREAIRFLAAKGLIEAKPKSGTRVRRQSDWNLLDPDILRWSLEGGVTIAFARDLFELRRCIEPGVARLAAERRSAADLTAMQDALSRMETLEPLSPSSIASDIAFHERMFDATGNRAFACLRSVVASTILWSLHLKRAVDNGAFVRSIADHRRIYDAIVARDAELAAAHTLTLVTSALTETEWAMSRVPATSLAGQR
jgi:GntR family transcriptional regulator, galactonate operon transcriptional repressor